MKNKKLFAILTLVCFMFTLMPVAAFAAPTDLSASASVFATVNANEDIKTNETIKAQISLKNANGGALAAAGLTTGTVYVWAETVSGQPSDAFVATATTPAGETAIVTDKAVAVAEVAAGVYEVTGLNTTTENSLAVNELWISFLRAGEYTLKASLEAPTANYDVKDVIVFAGGSADYKVVNVTADAADTTNWGVLVDGVLVKDGEESKDNGKTVSINAVGVKDTTVTLTVVKADGTTPVANRAIELDTDSSNIELNKTSLKTNHNGEATFKLSATREGNYKVYVSFGEVEAIINVTVGGTIANDIEVIKAPTGPLATTDVNYDSEIRFQITDVNGNVVKAADIGNATTANPGSAAAPYVTILEQPAANDIKDKEIWIEKHATKDCYVLQLATGEAFDEEGTYSVKVILDNGKSAVVTWEVKKFQTPVEIVIDAPESVELGTDFDVDLTFVDANGVEKSATKDVELAATGYAIENLGALTAGTANVQVKADEKYVGSVITLTAVSERYGLVETVDVKVAKEAVAVAFDVKSLAVDVNNKVEWDVVDEDGTPVKVNIDTTVDTVEISYIVLDKPEGAKVSVYDATETPFDGDGVLAVTSNKVGNVTVQAIVKVVISGAPDVTKYYTGVVVLPIGMETTGDVVVMSIGSNYVVVNNEIVEIPAPAVIKDARTFVPFRAIGEAFGAEVAWDAATQSVTAELNGVTIVLTIGSNTYTVNGVEKVADVAPFIAGDGYTMVPARLIAEAFGGEVLFTTDANGATADVLFLM